MFSILRLPQSTCEHERGAHLACRPGPPPSADTHGWQLFFPRHWGGPPTRSVTGACMLSISSPLSFFPVARTSTVLSPSSRFFLPLSPGGCCLAVSLHISGMLGGMISPLQALIPAPATVMTLVTPHPVLQDDCHKLFIDLLRPGAQAGDL